nr:MAG TPA: hypothetical protein [Caudoviricetes sp.]
MTIVDVFLYITLANHVCGSPFPIFIITYFQIL